MRVLVYPRDLEFGGSSINAVDLASAMRELGHETVLFAAPGPLAESVRRRGIPLVMAPRSMTSRPSAAAARALAATVREHRIDLVHTYEFWTCVEAFFGAGVLTGTPVLGTVMTMGLADYLPGSVPLTVGYRDLLDEARSKRRAPVHLLEPPIDTAADRPGPPDRQFVGDCGLDSGATVIVIVSRAAVAMKQEGIERTIDAVSSLAATSRVQLVVVGGGSAFAMLRERAEGVNTRLGRTVVILTGPMEDPRPAYAAADIVVGMGSSILRGLAFGKPAVVVGEEGFSLPVHPQNLPTFDRTGFYGVGTGRPSPADDPLLEQLATLVKDPDLRRRNGEFGVALVRDRFSLSAAALALDAIYLDTVQRRPGPARRGGDAIGTATRVVGHKAMGRLSAVRARRQPAVSTHD